MHSNFRSYNSHFYPCYFMKKNRLVGSIVLSVLILLIHLEYRRSPNMNCYFKVHPNTCSLSNFFPYFTLSIISLHKHQKIPNSFTQKLNSSLLLFCAPQATNYHGTKCRTTFASLIFSNRQACFLGQSFVIISLNLVFIVFVFVE